MDRRPIPEVRWLTELKTLIDTRHQGKEAEQLQLLSRLVFRPLLEDDEPDTEATAANRYGALLGIWQYLQQRDRKQTRIRVFNPDPERDGWRSAHSIIEILMDDMPFIVASCVTELQRQDVRVHQQTYPIFGAIRDDQGRLQQLRDEPGQDAEVETLVRFEIDHQISDDSLQHLETRLHQVLLDVRHAVEDWTPMMEKVSEAADWCDQSDACRSCADNPEAIALLRWLADEAFLFLGFRFYTAEKTEKGSTGCGISQAAGSAASVSRSPRTSSASNWTST
ncbi:hypothetical protein [Marinobacterium aestuariivivens]|uniref:NAD-glutamate dehydrogenase N-terminal ACT1 domain-containing protein n=1 Tax=Marinobacterium aestuariivivens TaxID=1698799 RepID=A0ABW2A147_9GAMM